MQRKAKECKGKHIHIFLYKCILHAINAAHYSSFFLEKQSKFMFRVRTHETLNLSNFLNTPKQHFYTKQN